MRGLGPWAGLAVAGALAVEGRGALGRKRKRERESFVFFFFVFVCFARKEENTLCCKNLSLRTTKMISLSVSEANDNADKCCELFLQERGGI